MSKVLMSVLLAANMDGSQKLEPFVIGKARAPCCFKNLKRVWMRHRHFTEWLQAWDAELDKLVRHACLLVDICFTHYTTCKLENINLKFLLLNARPGHH